MRMLKQVLAQEGQLGSTAWWWPPRRAHRDRRAGGPALAGGPDRLTRLGTVAGRAGRSSHLAARRPMQPWPGRSLAYNPECTIAVKFPGLGPSPEGSWRIR
jgi:hypothetical protein